MVKENHHYRQLLKITDESFDSQQLSAYHLCISYSLNRVRLAVLDVARHKFIALEDYELSNIFTTAQGAQVFQEAFSAHPYLFSSDWQQIKISVTNHNFTLIPDTLFEPEAAADYLRLNCDFDPERESIFTYHHQRIEAINIFSVDTYLQQVWQEKLPAKKITYLHLTSALISGLLQHSERNPERKLYAYIEKKSLCLLVIAAGKLEFCNLFQGNTPEDFLYFFIFVMQEQNLNPDMDRVTVWGDLTHDSALFTLLRTYIRNVQFGSRPAGVAYSYKLEDLFEHHYLDLYSLPFC
ncbi:MAG: hypothetical protein JWQ14_1106 [Adhaeribacter sp.]|nr:hypothetical protein [Adhaeribacter sp.]